MKIGDFDICRALGPRAPVLFVAGDDSFDGATLSFRFDLL